MSNKQPNNNNETPVGYNPNRQSASRKKSFNTSPAPLSETVTPVTLKQKADNLRRRAELVRKIYEELN